MRDNDHKIELVEVEKHALRVQMREHEIAPHDIYVLPPGSRHFGGGVVLRYMLMYQRGGEVSFVSARQGRHTFASMTPAERALRAIKRNNDVDKLIQLFGGPKNLFIGFVACYARHYDPAPIDLGSDLENPADIFNMSRLQRLVEYVTKARRDYPYE